MSNYSKFKAVSPKNLGGKAFVLRSWDQNESIIGTSSAMLKGWIAVISSGLLLYKNVHGSSYRRLCILQKKSTSIYLIIFPTVFSYIYSKHRRKIAILKEQFVCVIWKALDSGVDCCTTHRDFYFWLWSQPGKLIEMVLACKCIN